jgi:hypothetical protein
MSPSIQTGTREVLDGEILASLYRANCYGLPPSYYVLLLQLLFLFLLPPLLHRCDHHQLNLCIVPFTLTLFRGFSRPTDRQ